jgi:hypothetical protein
MGMAGRIVDFGMELLGRRWGGEIRLTIRPGKASEICCPPPHPAKAEKPYAVVLQGPVVDEADFTLETVRLYRRVMPGAVIILSTWVGSGSEKTRRAIIDEGVTWVENPDPGGKRGVLNVNRQVLSTRSGLGAAREAGAVWAFKTRTDQRVYRENLFGFCRELQRLFPTRATGQSAPFVGVASNCPLYIPYSWPDMFQFGHVKDLLALWSAPEDTRTKSPDFWNLSLREHASSLNPEAFVATHYLARQKAALKWTLADHWNELSNRWIIVDNESLGWYWFKHDRARDYQYLDLADVIANRRMTFSRWLCIRRGIAAPPKEEILGLPSMERVSWA